ncbi:hypothetical protein G647_04069 [Cladophialophora carrionii CBS 160.54]|uniref:Uncharacterized protein n=1 Tax=Cladophialophora carrionii CBS 160.54 TaxID=1279043 RepID=V9DCX0_9EURO|nr:uncharacterized protein G647_04069 [Cladophialophora carrionii CBS 160.54]ETI24700.1 hypothetical protein G647_04069 [Cladophialophora carrionii CBS 160.54]
MLRLSSRCVIAQRRRRLSPDVAARFSRKQVVSTRLDSSRASSSYVGRVLLARRTATG